MSGFVGGSLDDPGILADTLHYSSNRVVHADRCESSVQAPESEKTQ
jgi:hypothetical protein